MIHDHAYLKVKVRFSFISNAQNFQLAIVVYGDTVPVFHIQRSASEWGGRRKRTNIQVLEWEYCAVQWEGGLLYWSARLQCRMWL